MEEKVKGCPDFLLMVMILCSSLDMQHFQDEFERPESEIEKWNEK